ncbi:hypothetical protein HYW75_06435 [Candidatus Pacearchaeota archaeon]|nr:hypothetical protein [Candidatus Pacearchaeota archaeon]
MVELKVKLGQKGQLVIPKIFRDNYKMYPMGEVVVIAKEEGVLIKKQDNDIVEKLKEIAIKVNMKERLNQKSLRRLREEQYEERAKRAGIVFKE